jgi:hypothetical protein
MPEQKTNPESDAARSDGTRADENRELLKKKAEENLRNGDRDPPKDE